MVSSIGGDAPEISVVIDERRSFTTMRGTDATKKDAMRAGIEGILECTFEDGRCFGKDRLAMAAVMPVMRRKIEGLSCLWAASKSFSDGAVFSGEHIDCEEAIGLDRSDG